MCPENLWNGILHREGKAHTRMISGCENACGQFSHAAHLFRYFDSNKRREEGFWGSNLQFP